MKLYFCSLEQYEKNAARLQQVRLKGNMICLYGDCSRTAMKREHFRKANVFIADHGEFACSGCYTLYDQRSERLKETVQILRELNAAYAFRPEDPEACGGTLDLAVSDPALSNDRYTYMVRFVDEAQKEAAISRCRECCTFHFLDAMTAYLIFNDSDPRRALPSILQAVRLQPEDVVFVGEDQ